jgi:hypothetical protein
MAASSASAQRIALFDRLKKAFDANRNDEATKLLLQLKVSGLFCCLLSDCRRLRRRSFQSASSSPRLPLRPLPQRTLLSSVC